MDFFEKTIKIHSCDVTHLRQLRLSNLLGFFQEASISHTEALGVDRKKTLDRGLLWIIVKQSISITRMPRYDETVTLRTWPGPTLRVFFPRYYEVLSGNDVIIRGCAIWMLLDEKTRTFAFPDEYDISLDGFLTGDELPEPRSIAGFFANKDPLRFVGVNTYTARFSQVDINGHVNNSKYFDIIEDMIPSEEYDGYDGTEIQAEYLKEIRLGDTVSVKAYCTNDARLFDGGTEMSHFRIRIKKI